MLVRRIRRVLSEAKPPCVAGIDPSLRGTGIAIIEGGKISHVQGWTDKKTLAKAFPRELYFYKSKNSGDDERVERINRIVEWVMQSLADNVESISDLNISIEGYAFSKRSNRVSDLHELGGALKLAFWNAGIPFRIINPLYVKKAWTGNGFAEKAAMVKTCEEKFGIDLAPLREAGENIADAVLMAQLLAVELDVKRGLIQLENLDDNLRGVLLHTTKTEPTALISRPLIMKAEEDGTTRA